MHLTPRFNIFARLISVLTCYNFSHSTPQHGGGFLRRKHHGIFQLAGRRHSAAEIDLRHHFISKLLSCHRRPNVTQTHKRSKCDAESSNQGLCFSCLWISLQFDGFCKRARICSLLGSACNTFASFVLVQCPQGFPNSWRRELKLLNCSLILEHARNAY